nr:MAG TPA: hypothetical protein [Caudoviricetes sp.]
MFNFGKIGSTILWYSFYFSPFKYIITISLIIRFIIFDIVFF